MNLAELQTEVYAITNRPDLADRTLSAIRSATLFLHQKDFYWKDLKEQGIVFNTEGYLQQFEYRSLFPRFRSISYTRKTDINLYDQGEIFDIIQPTNVVDDYRANRTNVCYAAGAVLQYRSSTSFQYAILGFYENPDITLATYTSWIALDHPFAIVYRAAAQIFKSIGNTEEWNAWTQMANQQAQEIDISNIEARGI